MTGAGVDGEVVVTGLGVVTPIGADVESFWAAAMRGETRVEAIPRRWEAFFTPGSRIWAPLEMTSLPERGFTRIEMTQNDPVTLLGGAAALEALASAGLRTRVENRRQNTLRVEGVDPDRAGVVAGTGLGGGGSLLANHAHHLLSGVVSPGRPGRGEPPPSGEEEGAPAHPGPLPPWEVPARFHPFAVAMSMPNAPAAWLAIKLGWRGLAQPVCLACASGTAAVGMAFEAVRRGTLDVAVALGAEWLADEHGGIFRGFDVARTLTRSDRPPEAANRPFDEDRAGFLFSAGGAGALVLERAGHARARGAPVLARVAGQAQSFDAWSMMSMAPEGRQVERMIREAVEGAGLEPGDIDYVNAHGTGTEVNDAVEAEVLERVFGPRVRVSSTKSLIGHTIGASGAIEAVASVLSIARGEIHPSRGIERPVRPLAFVREPESAPVDAVLTHSFAFGGHNWALVLTRP